MWLGCSASCEFTQILPGHWFLPLEVHIVTPGCEELVRHLFCTTTEPKWKISKNLQAWGPWGKGGSARSKASLSPDAAQKVWLGHVSSGEHQTGVLCSMLQWFLLNLHCTHYIIVASCCIILHRSYTMLYTLLIIITYYYCIYILYNYYIYICTSIVK